MNEEEKKAIEIVKGITEDDLFIRLLGRTRRTLQCYSNSFKSNRKTI